MLKYYRETHVGSEILRFICFLFCARQGRSRRFEDVEWAAKALVSLRRSHKVFAIVDFSFPAASEKQFRAWIHQLLHSSLNVEPVFTQKLLEIRKFRSVKVGNWIGEAGRKLDSSHDGFRRCVFPRRVNFTAKGSIFLFQNILKIVFEKLFMWKAFIQSRATICCERAEPIQEL